ncbi:MAG: GNAT family N-acetyltransferase [Clostridia bacterium]|jgi:8-oxo-dGTP diphosphatase
MNITYKQFTHEYAEMILKLQHTWVYENITYGVVNETKEDILEHAKDYFYMAVDGEKVVGYITAEVVRDNEYNLFPMGADFLRVNDLYIRQEYRGNKIGEKLLSLVERKAYENGIKHIFITSATKDADAVRNFYTRNGYDIWTTTFFKRTDIDVRIYDLNYLKYYRFVVIFARYRDKWLYCKHKERTTWETAGGHIEIGETALEAAKRELYEETGAIKFKIRPMFDYSVHTPSDFSNGQVYLADITELSGIPDSEMSEVALFDTYPEELTYPQILPLLFEKVKQCK